MSSPRSCGIVILGVGLWDWCGTGVGLALYANRPPARRPPRALHVCVPHRDTVCVLQTVRVLQTVCVLQIVYVL